MPALKEMRRALKPGGVIGTCDICYGTEVVEPFTPLLRELTTLLNRLREHKGASRNYATRQRELLLAAGFNRVEAYAFSDHQGTVAGTRSTAREWASTLRDPATVRLAVAKGWADEAKLEAMATQALAWGERPDAFHTTLVCAAIGRADERS
jgi:hypothetical protein